MTVSLLRFFSHVECSVCVLALIMCGSVACSASLYLNLAGYVKIVLFLCTLFSYWTYFICFFLADTAILSYLVANIRRVKTLVGLKKDF
jgi:hypothetical protein